MTAELSGTSGDNVLPVNKYVRINMLFDISVRTLFKKHVNVKNMIRLMEVWPCILEFVMANLFIYRRVLFGIKSADNSIISIFEKPDLSLDDNILSGKKYWCKNSAWDKVFLYIIVNISRRFQENGCSSVRGDSYGTVQRFKWLCFWEWETAVQYSISIWVYLFWCKSTGWTVIAVLFRNVFLWLEFQTRRLRLSLFGAGLSRRFNFLLH